MGMYQSSSGSDGRILTINMAYTGSHSTPVAAWPWKLDILPDETGTLVVNVWPNSTLQDSSESSTKDSSPSSDALQFLLREAHAGQQHLIKLLLPVLSGYVVQSDFLERRMVDCLDVNEVRSFVAPGQQIQGRTAEAYKSMNLSDLLSSCYGVIVLETEDRSAEINKELLKRLSFPWLSSNLIARKRLAIVGGASLSKLKGFTVAAASLNIALTVFDEPSHWISSDAYAYLREEFVPLDMTVDPNMAQRIAAALSEYQNQSIDKRLDGVMTADEHLLTTIAHAAALLGLPTSPPKSVGLAQNKFQTRLLDKNIYCRLVRSAADLDKLLAEDGSRLPYPLIVKPARGWSSEGVWKVANEQELSARVRGLWQDAFTAWHGCDVVVETYIDGPEVDANMVLVDGKIVFFEANDDFPSPGDYYASNDKDLQSLASKNPVPNFVEASNMIPSALPQSELAALQQRLHELALAAGFRDGVLHMEARLRNSSCHYTSTSSSPSSSSGFVDLRPKSPPTTSTKVEDVFLLEINPRQPGWQEIEATAHAYGVSYYSLSLLHSLGDKSRLTALSQPFLGGQPQYHMQLLFVSAQRGGMYRYGDVCASVLHPSSARGRELAKHVVKSANLMEDGQDIPDPSTGMVYGCFIAFFLVVSRRSRAEAMQIGRQIEGLVREVTEGF